MDEKEMAARPEASATTSENQHSDGSRKTKIETILGLFVRGLSLNRFQAELHHDHCLHSTVSTLENCHGILIERVSEVVPCLSGSKTVRCKRYWLKRDPENVKRANVLLKYWRSRA